jgi:hypothetical protein
MSEKKQPKKLSEINWSKNWKNVRIILSAILIFTLIVIVASNYNSLFYRGTGSQSEIDWREISLLIVTGTIVLWLKLPDDLVADIKNRKKEWVKLSLFLLLFFVGIVAVWYAVRAIGSFVFRISIELDRSPIRQASNVLSLIGYVVAANLPFTLLRTYQGGNPEKGDQNLKARENAYEQNLKIIKGTIDVILQAILIILLTFVPIIGQKTMLQGVGGYIGFATIFFSILVTLIVFLMIRKRICSEMLYYK